MGEIRIFSGRMPGGLKCVVYGPEGIGKTTFASHFPDPVFIDTEGSTKHMDVQRTERPQSWAELMSQVQFFAEHPDRCGTLVIDTADWAEQLCMDAVCRKYEKKGIEDFGYGKGYVYLREEFGKLLDALEEVLNTGHNVLILAHAAITKFEQPDAAGSYDRWTMKTTKQVEPLIREWCDMLLFVNYQTVVEKSGSAPNAKNKVTGGRRVMYTTHHPCWDAKNRFGLPDEMPFDYASIAACIPGTTPAPASQPEPHPRPQPKPQSAPEEDILPAPAPQPEPPAETVPKALLVPDLIALGVPEKLAPLMSANNVTPEELQAVVGKRGYFPEDMPIRDYPADFVEGCLVAAWPQVLQMVLDSRDLPF